MNIRPAIITFSALITLGVLAAPTMAKDPSRATVHTADLDLRIPGDVEILYTRLSSAAREVCAAQDRVDPLNFYRAHTYQDCVAATVADVVARAGLESLTAVHQMRTDRRELHIADAI